jgi:signal peptidase II
MLWGLLIIVPGALGNLFDRVIHSSLGVVDFIRIGISDTVYWPIFNFADAYVTIGVTLVALNFLQEEQRRKVKSGATSPIETPLEKPSHDAQ